MVEGTEEGHRPAEEDVVAVTAAVLEAKVLKPAAVVRREPVTRPLEVETGLENGESTQAFTELFRYGKGPGETRKS
ncbi:hypothetical protein [Streptomyces sp. st115]|uniref:hypothetical protein n=1 Tax=Streptomyces sp. st115 TaxID=1828047 RepID=UPI001180C66D|nr:hypothetical protein [Streptomyces sp. st115]